ncbi:MAG TPA: beta-propeller fold lactonase family protein, partial [Acidobacteriaceae bacterium]
MLASVGAAEWRRAPLDWHWVSVIGDNRSDMTQLTNSLPQNDGKAKTNATGAGIPAGGVTRRRLLQAGAASLAMSALPGLARTAAHGPQRILVGSGGPQNGILGFGWDAKTGVLTPQGIAADVSHSTWLGISPDKKYLYVACELEEFEGKPTGAVASFALNANAAGTDK